MTSEHITQTRWTGSGGRARSAALLLVIVLLGGALAAWKRASTLEANAAAAHQPEPVESITTAVAREQEHRPTTTSIGTVLALSSVTLRNEIAGTVRRVALQPGQIVEAGTLLVALDVSVEQAELEAQQAQAHLAQTSLARLERLAQAQAVSQEEVDQARAAVDVATAQVERTRAVIARKIFRAPFRARVGLSDLHPGQYLNEGTVITTLQGVDRAAHVDFTVAQVVAASLAVGQAVTVFASGDSVPLVAHIVAIDARVDPTTRNALVRARISDRAPAPGASVRVEVPVGPLAEAVAVPVSALRKGPGGEFVFVVRTDSTGQSRAHEQPVKSGSVVDDQVLVLNGLNPGDKVATSGSFKLRESVLVVDAGAAQAPGTSPASHGSE
jgi:membrane fusion protein (multidrug efflux system)